MGLQENGVQPSEGSGESGQHLNKSAEGKDLQSQAMTPTVSCGVKPESNQSNLPKGCLKPHGF